MNATSLPSRGEMVRAYQASDATYDSVFVTAVRTTGVFCRPACPARKPLAENVEFFACPRDALLAGYRPCLRCRPMELAGAAPPWLRPLLERVEADGTRRWKDGDLRSMGLNPDRVRRWFLRNHGMTFHAYSRARRLGLALGRIQVGANVATAAFDHGYESLSGFHEAVRQLVGAPPMDVRDAPVIALTRVLTPLGPMIAGATAEALVLLEFAERRMLERQLRTLRSRLRATFVPGDNAVLRHASDELARYFAGQLREFSTPVSAPGTELQRSVWDALRQIPFGSTVSYGEVARRVGRAAAVRTVAGAVGDNRIAVLIPCHRVVGSDGALTGYGGGIWRKRRLLDLEGAGTRPGELTLFTPAA